MRPHLGEYDYRVELGIVQLVHGVGRHVEKGVEALVHNVPDGGQTHYPRPFVLPRTARILFYRQGQIVILNPVFGLFCCKTMTN